MVNTNCAPPETAGNDNFSAPNPPLATISAKAAALRVAIGNAAQGGKNYTAIRDAKEQELVDALIILAHYVTDISNGNEEMILSSGMPVRKPNTKLPVPSAPENLRIVRQEIEGHAILGCDKVVGARMYVIQRNTTTTLDNNAWTQVAINPTTRYEITDMSLVNKVAYRICALGTAGSSAWSDTISTPTW